MAEETAFFKDNEGVIEGTMLDVAPWTTWWQTDLPCQFSQTECCANSAFLTEVLGESWIEKAATTHSNHPLGMEWATNGAGAFLQLNALADDIRLIRTAPGFNAVLDDLRDGKQCRAAWHVVRTAAMFARGGASVCEFFRQTDVKVPDFVIRASSRKINVEAKLLLNSDKEEAFTNFASPLLDTILKQAMSAEAVHPHVIVVFTNSEQLPPAGAVLDAVSALLHDSSAAQSRVVKSELFNVFLEPAPATTGLYRLCYLLCPRLEKENLRVASRARAASHQLLSDMARKRPGIMWLGMTQHQDARSVYDLLMRKFRDAQYLGISIAILSLSGTHVEPPRRTVVDYLLTISNPRAKFTLPARVPLKPLDLSPRLIDFQQILRGVSAYRCAASEVRVQADTKGVFLPDIRRIDPAWL